MFIYNNEKQNKKWVSYKLNKNIMINEKRQKKWSIVNSKSDWGGSCFTKVGGS